MGVLSLFRILRAFALAAALFLVAYFLPVSAGNSNSRPVGTAKGVINNVLRVRQEGQVFGKTELYIADIGCRLIAREGDLIITAKAPEWRLLAYGKGRNVGLLMTKEEQRTSHFSLLGGGAPISGAVRKPGKSLIFGAKYFDAVATATQNDNKSHDAAIFQDRTTKIVIDSTTRFSEVVNLSQPQKEFLTWLFKTGNFGYIPLQERTRYVDGTSKLGYHTTSIEHVSVPANFFDYPTGYKKETELMMVLVQNGYADTMEDLWGSAPGDKKK